MAARLKQDICQALNVQVNNVFMRTDSTTVLQWINSTSKQPMFIANRVCEILENTSLDEWNYFATSDNLADSGIRDMSAEVLQSSNWVRVQDFLRTNEIAFGLSSEVVKNISIVILKRKLMKPLHNCQHP